VKNVVLLLLGSFVCAGLGAADPAEHAASLDEETVAAVTQAVLAVNDAMTQAGNSGDVEALFARIVDGANPIIQDGRLFATKLEAQQVVEQGYQGIAKLERAFAQPAVTVLSPTAALLTAAGTTSVVLEDGRTFSSPFAVTLVFVLTDGEWRVLHGHYSVPNRG